MNTNDLSLRELTILQAALGDYLSMRARFSRKEYLAEVRALRERVDGALEEHYGKS